MSSSFLLFLGCNLIMVLFYYLKWKAKRTYYKQINRAVTTAKLCKPKIKLDDNSQNPKASRLKHKDIAKYSAKSFFKGCRDKFSWLIRHLILFSFKKLLFPFDVITLLVISVGKPALVNDKVTSIYNFVSSVFMYSIIFTLSACAVKNYIYQKRMITISKKKVRLYNMMKSSKYHYYKILEFEAYTNCLDIRHSNEAHLGQLPYPFFSLMFFYIMTATFVLCKECTTFALFMINIIYMTKLHMLVIRKYTDRFLKGLDVICWFFCCLMHICLL